MVRAKRPCLCMAVNHARVCITAEECHSHCQSLCPSVEPSCCFTACWGLYARHTSLVPRRLRRGTGGDRDPCGGGGREGGSGGGGGGGAIPNATLSQTRTSSALRWAAMKAISVLGSF